jgi:hypothetical protein
VNIDEHILQALAATPAQTLTIGDLARQFGVSTMVVLPAARRLVDDGLARPSFVQVHGVPTLRGLLAAPSSTPSADAPA